MESKKNNEEHLFSSTCMISGVYGYKKSHAIDIGHMFSHVNKSYNYYVIKSYGEDVNHILTLFSVMFGKCFYYNGILKFGETYFLPNLNKDEVQYNYLPSHNNKERIDKFLDLNRTEIGKILKLLKKEKKEVFLEAGYFYKKALINVNYDSQIGFIDLVRCIEVLSNSVQHTNTHCEADLSGETKEIYLILKQKGTSDLTNRFLDYHGSTKRFCNTILNFLPTSDVFWSKTESSRNDRSIPSLNGDESTIRKCLKNIYSVRSKYLHSGLSFGFEVMPRHGGLNELLHGTSGVTNGDERIPHKLLTDKATFTFSGLERIVRQTLINYITQ